MLEADPSAHVRTRMQATSELLNTLLRLAAPEKLGAFPDSAWPSLRELIDLLRSEGSGPAGPPVLELGALSAMLPELAAAAADAATSPQARAKAAALARGYLSSVSSCAPLLR